MSKEEVDRGIGLISRIQGVQNMPQAQDPVPALISADKGEDQNVRRNDFEALIAIGPRAVPALSEMLKSKVERDVRNAAIGLRRN